MNREWYVVHFADGADVLVRAYTERNASLKAQLKHRGLPVTIARVPNVERVWRRVAEALQRTYGPPNQKNARFVLERGFDITMDFGSETEGSNE